MNKTILLFMFLVLSCLLKAQEAKPQQDSKKHFVLFSAGYRLPVSKNPVINSGHGLYLEAGFNPARFFSSNAVIGVYAGWGWRDHLWSTSFDPSFIKEYRNSVNAEALNGRDSAIVRFSEELFGSKSGRSLPLPGCGTNSFHDYALCYGMVLQPNEAWPVLKLYTGSKRAHYQGTEDVFRTRAEYSILQLRRKMYGAELMLRNPLRYVAGKRILPSWLANTGISFYYEYSDLSVASLYFSDGERQSGILLKQFMKKEFFDTYKKEQVIGFRFSYVII